ncbi:MAG: peptidoglycan DD-metalloendopeptidase family protein [Paracoccaceae bacterium]|tara:strand:- start:365 stop:1525 length:1161 start_codon:yes stop_codon:yes gene_type:complete
MIKPKLTKFKYFFLLTILWALSACENSSLSNFDFDFRGNSFDTSDAALQATQSRPKANELGIISYPTYQIAVARRDDTIESMAERLGQNPGELARYNGLAEGERLRNGEVLALPRTGSRGGQYLESSDEIEETTLSKDINVLELADNALKVAGGSANNQLDRTSSDAKNLMDPIKHNVVRGETVFTISRLYNISVRSLADWNGLDSDYTLREGQILIIPLVDKKATKNTQKEIDESAVPAPPSSKKPQPRNVNTQEFSKSTDTKISVPENGKMAYPLEGLVIREYSKNINDGIDFTARAGTKVVAADTGLVATVTEDINQIAIVVLKHPGNILTVYANLTNIKVSTNQNVNRGDILGEIPDGDPPYLHFEIREGFESVDPLEYLNN